MALLILNQYSEDRFHMTNFREWLAGLDEELYMFTDAKHEGQFQAYDHVQFFTDFHKNERVEIEALRLFREKPFRLVLALDERDIVRAARIRERLGLPGQGLESAIAYRDKTVMKPYIQRANLACAHFRKLETAYDLYDFVQQHGLPVVVKPVDGLGSIGTSVISTEEDLENVYAKGQFWGTMVETFVPGPMFDVDGMIVDGEMAFCSVGRYVNGAMTFHENIGLLVEMVAPQEPIFARIQEFCRQVIAAMPNPQFSSFHFELFHTPDDQLVFCEIASRTAGGRIAECVRQSYGIDLNREWVRLEAGLEAFIPSTASFSQYSAVYLIPKQNGKLLSMIESFPFDWVTEFIPRMKAGEDATGTASSIDTIGGVVFVADSQSGLQEAYQKVLRYVEEHVQWEKQPEQQVVV
jgi:ATP-grasp domain